MKARNGVEIRYQQMRNVDEKNFTPSWWLFSRLEGNLFEIEATNPETVFKS